MKNQKSVLFVSTSLSKGGVGKMVNYIAGVLCSEFESVYAVNVGRDNYFTMNNGVHYLPPLMEHQSGIINMVKSVRAVRKIIKTVKPDIVVSFVSDISFLTRVATLDMRKITIVSAERGDPYTLNWVWKKLVKWAYSNSDYCFFQLENARNFFGPRVIKHSFVIPNAAFFSGRIGSHSAEKKTIVSAGRFVPEKGYEDLFKAFATIHQLYSDYRLVLYGEGPLQNEYKELVNVLGINEFVDFPGYVSNVGEAIEKDGIFVLPSRYEGIPNVLIEALLVGIPTVSSDCTPGGPRFLTRNGEIGTLYPTGNVKC